MYTRVLPKSDSVAQNMMLIVLDYCDDDFWSFDDDDVAVLALHIQS